MNNYHEQLLLQEDEMNKKPKIETKAEALELALRLALGAPDEAKSKLAVTLAELIAKDMGVEEIEQVKSKLDDEIRAVANTGISERNTNGHT